jgi:hypothetical protein
MTIYADFVHVESEFIIAEILECLLTFMNEELARLAQTCVVRSVHTPF